MNRTIVRVTLSPSRRMETERELSDYSARTIAGRPFRQGTANDLLWEFSGPEQLADAQMFRAAIAHTPGIARVHEPVTVVA